MSETGFFLRWDCCKNISDALDSPPGVFQSLLVANLLRCSRRHPSFPRVLPNSHLANAGSELAEITDLPIHGGGNMRPRVLKGMMAIVLCSALAGTVRGGA